MLSSTDKIIQGKNLQNQIIFRACGLNMAVFVNSNIFTIILFNIIE